MLKDDLETNFKEAFDRVGWYSKWGSRVYYILFEKFPKCISDNKSIFLTSTLIFSSIKNIPFSMKFIPLTTLLFAFFNVTLLAVLYGVRSAYYPLAKFYLKSSKRPLVAHVIKFGKLVYCIIPKTKKKIFINKDDILRVEESLFKEENQK